MRLKDLKPATGEGGRVGLGFLLTFVLHFIAFVVVAMIGGAVDPHEGALTVLPFLALIGIAQWLYLGPVIWWLRRRGSIAVMKGVTIGGGLMMLGNGLCYGGMGLLSLRSAADTQRIQQYERDHPRDAISAKGVVTLVDTAHFEFRRDDDGSVISLQTWGGTDYALLKKDGGYEPRTRDILTPDAHVSVDYVQERGKPPGSASTVRVYEEAP